MQSLAAYAFEAEDADPPKRLQEIDLAVDEWLSEKGAADPRVANGDFQSKTGDGVGQFSRTVLSSREGTLREIELLETAHTGASFTTRVQVANTGSSIAVYISLSATPGRSVVAPMRLVPRCPGIVRALITRYPDWKFAGQELPPGLAFDATTEDAATVLCGALRSPARRLPIIVVSTDEDEVVWKELPHKLAEQLIGLANVAYVGAESSWVLTDELGEPNSCYLGAVRLYWPVVRSNGDFEATTWLPTKLAAFGRDSGGMNRFVTSLRRTVMSTAALTMLPQKSVREVSNAAARERLQNLSAVDQEQQLNSIVDENAQLSADLAETKAALARAEWKIAALEQRGTSIATDDDEETPAAEDSRVAPPEKGEVRYYKKIGSGGGVDTLVRTGSCNHNARNWKSAFKGDQAEKGLLKLEGSSDWQSLFHCSACTGGGRWRVHW